MRRRVQAARVGRLATVGGGGDGTPHLVPVCFALLGETVYSAVDYKPKRGGRLRRVANLQETGRASLLVDEYDEDWTRLWWIRLDGRGRVVDDPTEAGSALAALAEKYPQYQARQPEGPVIAVDVRRWSGWAGGAPSTSVVEQLGLEPHPEGGWFRETWRSPTLISPPGYPGDRAAATAIYYLLHPGEESRWHVVRSAELWLWHWGGPLALRLGGSADEPRSVEEVRLGSDLAVGERPQVVVPGGTWQSAAPAGQQPVLVSCVVAPGFDYADFRLLPA
jgi:PPOX class probable F420-dependent enzyme